MKQISFEEFIEKYKTLDLYQQRWIRDAARRELISEGEYELGSSDVSCRAYHIYQRYGSFSALLEYLIEHSI